MQFDQITTYFLPLHLKSDKSHPQYQEFRSIVTAAIVAVPLVLLFPALIYFLHKPIEGYLINGGLIIFTLFSIKYFGHYRIPMTLTAFVTYFIIYDWIRSSGFIFSVNTSVMHMYLAGAIWADRKYGVYTIFTNLLLFGFIYYQTLEAGFVPQVQTVMGDPVYPLMMHCLITVFFGGFLAYLQLDQERDRVKIKALQDQKINILDEIVKKRTEQLNTMRETIATDFHDETGNTLSAITRQATLLKTKLIRDHEVMPVVENIITNSNNLYAASKDFLWNLNHNSDDPIELFQYLTGYGQVYYNQFDMAFSSRLERCEQPQLEPMAALNIIYIFKEAMTNVIKHADAREVLFEMICYPDKIIYALQDDGSWKPADQTQAHYGLSNMERRSRKNRFDFQLIKLVTGTRVEVVVRANTLT